MIRTIISLTKDDKRWLDAQAEREGVPMTEIVRRAVALLRRSTALDELTTDELLARTAGSWRGGDGLAHQRSLRGEWDRG